MRFFVSEATVAAWLAHGEAEIARLREDRVAELARLADAGPFVAHLKDEVAFWRLQFIKERQRAEVAIDACRVQHQGTAAVALPLRPQGEGGALMGQAPGLDVFSDPELAAMGLTEGR